MTDTGDLRSHVLGEGEGGIGLAGATGASS